MNEDEQETENKPASKRPRQDFSTEYLKALYVFWLQKGRGARSCELAGHMNFTRPSVSKAVKRLRAEGLVTVDEAALVCLTEAGRERARQVYEKHSFFEKLLVNAGVDAAVAGAEASRLVHGISTESFCKLSDYIESVLPECGGYEKKAI